MTHMIHLDWRNRAVVCSLVGAADTKAYCHESWNMFENDAGHVRRCVRSLSQVQIILFIACLENFAGVFCTGKVLLCAIHRTHVKFSLTMPQYSHRKILNNNNIRNMKHVYIGLAT